jgi:acid phosphatase family membrane protein YuiD
MKNILDPFRSWLCQLQDLLSTSLSVVYIIPILCYGYTLHFQHLFIWIGIILTTCISEFIKYTVIGNQSLRPIGARDCNMFCTDGPCEHEPGMPSSHSATVVYFACSYIAYLTYAQYPLITIGLVVYAFLVMLSRYLKRCHTIYQIGAGAILGVVLYTFFKNLLGTFF